MATSCDSGTLTHEQGVAIPIGNDSKPVQACKLTDRFQKNAPYRAYIERLVPKGRKCPLMA